jgi:hypothetical protein
MTSIKREKSVFEFEKGKVLIYTHSGNFRFSNEKVFILQLTSHFKPKAQKKNRQILIYGFRFQPPINFSLNENPKTTARKGIFSQYKLERMLQ